jgi:glutathione peroxidase
MNIYDFTVRDKKQRDVSLRDYQGKVLLIVNTATGCGFTPQYADLERLHEQYAERGLAILDFPCNQFLEQAPGTDEEITQFCTVNFGTKYPQFAKIDVNGDQAHPLYVYLRSLELDEIGNTETEKFTELLASLGQTRPGHDIKWNFTKFLVDRQGNVVARFSPTITGPELAPHIEALL